MKKIVACLLIICIFLSTGVMRVLGGENETNLTSVNNPIVNEPLDVLNTTEQIRIERDKYYLSICPSEQFVRFDDFMNTAYTLNIDSMLFMPAVL